MDISAEEYSLAILKLTSAAQGDTGGARVAAQVLLSAYNGEAYQLNVVDLCNLDKDHYQAALSVIRGRKELGREPHNFLKDGDLVFKGLWKRWERYHVENRGKPTCNLCYGSGLVPEYPDDENNYSQKTCTKCGGKGY